MKSKFAGRDAAIAAALAVLSIAWSWSVLGLWWTFDDPFHLNLIAPRAPSDLFLSSALWRGFPSHVFTPLLLASLKADLYAAGLNPRAFYLHQIAVFACLAPVMYLMLRRWFTLVGAACGAIVAMAGIPLIECVQRLMDRHYLEGLLIALISVLSFQRKSVALTTFSAMAYLFAMAAKEIFVPLVFVLVVIAGLRSVVPHAVALAIYCIWRFAVAGPHLESYGWAVARKEWPRLIATLPLRFVRVLSGGNAIGVIAMILVAAAIVIVAARRPRSRLLILIAACAALLPILPVSFEIQQRYGLVSWIFISIAVAALPSLRWLLALQIAIVLAVVVSSRAQWSESFRAMERMSKEDRALSRLNAGDLLWMPSSPPATLEELSRLTKTRASWTYDELPLCAGRLSARRFFEFEQACDCVGEVRGDRLSRACSADRVAPLSAGFHFEGGSLFWDFGPYESGQYKVILADGRQGFTVPRHAGFHLGSDGRLLLRVRYESPAGWVTYSDDLQVSLREGETTSWQR